MRPADQLIQSEVEPVAWLFECRDGMFLVWEKTDTCLSRGTYTPLYATRPTQPMSLLPIDTCPRDGTPFYAYLPGYDGCGPLVLTAWRDYWMNKYLNGGVANPEAFTPHWWMPIPEPTAISKAEGK